MFKGFTSNRIVCGAVQLRVRYGGQGDPVLLLHGHPRTHATWEFVAPLLAEKYSVVCPDLRGYGESSKPTTTQDHTPYSKRAMAQDCIELMRVLGHTRFAVVGHDRGAYVAFRMAMDYQAEISHLVVMDGVPIGEALARCNARFATSWWHWFFLGQPAPLAERVINADPDAWYNPSREHMSPEALDDLRAAMHDPLTVHAMCEDYRAGLSVDRSHDDQDKEAGKRLACPTLFIWARRDDMEELYGDPASVWREWADDLQAASVDCGHHIAEEAPEELAQLVATFIAA